MKFSLFGSSDDLSAKIGPVSGDPGWARNRAHKFHRLIHLKTDDPDLAQGGIFVIWHGGVRPKWVYAGAAENLGTALESALDNENVTGFERNGGLFVSWLHVVPKDWAGVLSFLAATTNFLVISAEMERAKGRPIPVALPGA